MGELQQSSEGTLEFKPLERKRGFLIYVTRTFPSMVPYLKGIHQTLDTWRPNRREDGWKMTPREIQLRLRAGEGGNVAPQDALDQPPARVKAAPRLSCDLEGLTELTSSLTPPRRLVRSGVALQVFYGFGDASGVGHASNFQGFKRN